MTVSLQVLLTLLAYAVVARATLLVRGQWKAVLFALTSLAGTAAVFYWVPQKPFVAVAFGWYLVVVTAQYAAITLFKQGSRFSVIPIVLPVVYLVVLKYGPAMQVPIGAWLSMNAATFVGISYMAFRLSYLALEVRVGTVPPPSYANVLGYAFFLPTLVIGPISRYSTFFRSFSSFSRTQVPILRCLARMVVGGAKVFFLGNLFNQLSFDGLMLDGNGHHRLDLAVACVSYYLFLFCNFSGFCDLVIGYSGLIGIRVDENFDHPLVARNVKDFWNRWHITLSRFMRDMLFTPLSKFLGARLGPWAINHAIALATVVVFVSVGLWHGVGWNFFWFGVLHAAGVVGNHYYLITMKHFLGAERMRAYNQNALIRYVSISLTFIYVSATFAFFANSPQKLRLILQVVRWD